MNEKHKLADKFNPKDFEDKLYEEWESKGFFKPSADKTKEPYCIMMPPPNVTGKLHMGHALDDTIQDTVSVDSISLAQETKTESKQKRTIRINLNKTKNDKKVEYVCYAVKANSLKSSAIIEYADFVPISLFSSNEGYYITYRDAITGEVLKKEK